MSGSGPGSIVVVVGTDTGVGKTMVTAGLAYALAQRGVSVVALKPVETGIARREPESTEDGVILAKASGQAEPRQALIRLRAALAPPVAAELEDAELDMGAWCQAILAYAAAADLVLVEGAGGLLSPLTWTATSRELAQRLNAHALLVAADRLGTINHTLMAVEILERSHVPLVGIVLSALPRSDASRGLNAEALRRLSGLERIEILPLVSGFEEASQHLRALSQALVPPAPRERQL